MMFAATPRLLLVHYKLLFSVGHPAASDLAHIGEFYAQYVI